MPLHGALPTSVLATKLFIPPPRPNAVLRADLIARLNAGLNGKLTLISAPAGFGKTSLVSQWLSMRAEGGRLRADVSESQPSALSPQPSAFAWLSLDPADNDPARFLAHLVAALQTLAPTLGTDIGELLQSAQPPPIDAVLPLLLNQLVTLPAAILVLDDYHVLDSRPIDQALTVLVEHLPPQLHLVITTREDPPLPLARLRARGQLTELRAADLRFTPDEAAAFLTEVMGLSLAANEIAALEARTEGWIAGLQLAALSMQGRADMPGFIQAFAGDHRYIVDYLVEEVLQRQPESIRSFLLQTAILDRLSGPLCDAVLGIENSELKIERAAQSDLSSRSILNSQLALERLERGNFFVVPLDNTRQWYRYHHLFAEVLLAHLREEQPDLVATLHRRASAWYEQHGVQTEAIRHALAGTDFARAADLVELIVPAMRRSRREAALLGWLKALPDEVIQVRPVLSMHYAGTLLSTGERDGVEARLHDAEQWLDVMIAVGEQAQARLGTMVVRDEATFRSLPGWIAVYRAGQSLVLGNVSETEAYARQALDLVAEDDHLGRGAARALLGLAAWTSGDLEVAHRSYADSLTYLQRAGHLADTMGCAIALADIRLAQGRLHEAMHTYEQRVQLATAHGPPLLRGTADMYVGMSEIFRERNDLPAAIQCLHQGQKLGEAMGLPQYPYRWREAMARIKEAQGDRDGACALLDEAERRYASDFFPNVRPVAALKIRVWVAQGQLHDALAWTREQGLSAQDELSYLREFEHITLARVLLACATRDRADHDTREAIELLERLLHAAEAGERTGSVIEILVMQALAYQAQGDIPAALVPLTHALTLAEPEGYIRIFVDEGPAMAELLERMQAEGGRMHPYILSLLAAFDKAPALARPIPQPSALSPQPLPEPLSERERDVLRLLGTYLSGPEIARQLMMSLNTLRTHTKNIYAKLGVNSRQAAVRRAEELALL